MDRFWDKPAVFVKSFVGISRDNILLGRSLRQILAIPNQFWKKVVVAGFYPAGWILSRKYK